VVVDLALYNLLPVRWKIPGLVRDLVTVVAGVVVGAGVYLGVARLLRVQELALLLDVVRRRGLGARGTGPSSS
jgi:hypothetical protein